jgi:uncharacterized membrane protein
MGDDVLMVTVINKAIIIPIVALIALILKSAFGVELGTEAQDIIADGILGIITLVGIFLHPKKKTVKDKKI